MKKTLLLAALAAAVPSLSAAQTHPHLLYGPGDVSTLRSRGQGTHKDIFGALKKGVDDFVGTSVSPDGTVTWSDGRTFNVGDRRDIGNALIVFAFVWQIDGGQQYWDVAHRWLMTVASWGNFDLDGTGDLVQAHVLTGAAIAYDILWPGLSDGERSQVRGAIAQNAASLRNAGLNGVGFWWEREYLMNHNWIDHEAVGLAALAIEGEWDQGSVDTWRNYATDNAKAIVNATDGITDGTWHEGLGYCNYGLMWHMPFTDALKRAGHEDLTGSKFLRAVASVRAHSQIADDPKELLLTYADFYGFGGDEGLFAMRWAASHFQDGVAQAAADRQAALNQRSTYAPEAVQGVLEFLFYDPSVASADLHQEALDWFGSDLQAVVFRGGWDKGATLFALKSGTYGGRSIWQRLKAGDTSVGTLNFGHDHADDNGFYLYGNGSWLAPEAEGYGAGNANGTSLHNTLTIDGQSQLMEQGTSDESQSYPWFSQREGSIPFHAASADFAYAIGDGAHLYDPSMGLTRWDRHVLFLDRKWVVLRDVIESSQPHDYTWNVHFMDAASRDGSWIHGVGKNGQALGVAMVAPAQWNANTTMVSPQRTIGLDPDGSIGQASLTPASPAPNVNFLAALVPVADASWSSRPQVAAIDASAPDAGLTVTDGGRLAVALFNAAPDGTQRVGGYHLDGVAGVAEYDGGAPSRAVLVQGTVLEDSQRKLLVQSGGATMLEADGLAGDVVTLSGDKLGQTTLYAPRASRLLWYGADVPFTRNGEYVTTPGVAAAGQVVAGDGTAAQAASMLASRMQGGCSAGGKAELAAFVLPALFLALRRRRRPARNPTPTPTPVAPADDVEIRRAA